MTIKFRFLLAQKAILKQLFFQFGKAAFCVCFFFIFFYRPLLNSRAIKFHFLETNGLSPKSAVKIKVVISKEIVEHLHKY